MNLLLALAARWRTDADFYECDGAFVRGEAVLRRAADELEAAVDAWQSEELTIAQAATESGYTEDHLRQLVREGRIPDNRSQDSKGEIHVRRCDLPRKLRGKSDSVVEDMAVTLLKARR